MLDLYLLGQNCLHLTFKPYLSSKKYFHKYEKLPNIVVHACKILENCVETVKWLDYNRYSLLTQWCSGNTSALGARVPGFNPRLRQGVLCLNFLFCCCCVSTFLSKTHYLLQNFAIPFTMLIY